jgi:hypothetical protein
MKKIYNFIGAIALLAVPFMASSQVNINEDFESGDPAGWTLNNFSSSYFAGNDCDGSSLGGNVYGFSPSADFTTATATAAGGQVNITFDYKVVDYNSNDAAAADFGSITLEHEVDGGGFVVDTIIDLSNHLVANTCATVSTFATGIEIPAAGVVAFRMSVVHANGDYDVYIDNFSALEVVSCPNPTGLALVSADNVSADVTWDLTVTPEWQVEYGAVGFTPGIGTGTTLPVVVTNAANIPGLTSNQFYDVYVRAICAVGDTSGWTGALGINTYDQAQYLTFDTECGPGYTDISATGTSTALGDDGTVGVTMPFSFLYQGTLVSDVTIANNGTIWLGTLTGDAFTYSPNITTEADALFPFGDDLDEESGDVFYETVGIAPNRTFIVQYENRFAWNGANAQTGVTFQAIIEEATNEMYFFYEDVEFGQDLAGNDFGASAAIGASGPNNDVVVSDYNADFLTNNSCVHLFYTDCPMPNNLMVTDFDNDTIVVTWAQLGASSAWEVNYGMEGFDPETEGTISTSDDLTDTLDVLDQLTSYDIYVRSDCGGEVSGWFGPVNETTLPNCADPSLLPVGYVAEDTIEVSFVDNAGALNWNFQYGEAGFDIGSGTTMSTMTTTDSIIDPSLMGSLVYDVYVQADCLTPGDTSNWVGPIVVAMPIANDSTCDAIALTVDGSIRYFNNTGATAQIDENTIEPATDGYNTQTGWGEGGTEYSTWFTFEAPTSGIVEITTKDEDYSGQIAVYETTDCSDFSTFTLLGANDDGYTAFFGGAELTLCGLTAGNTYYIMHDNNDFTGEGNYSISITEIAQPEAGNGMDTVICAGADVDLNSLISGFNAEGVWNDLVYGTALIQDDTLFTQTGLLAYQDFDFEYRITQRCAMDSVLVKVTTVGPSNAGDVTGTLDACFHTAVNLFDGLTGSVDLGGVWYDQTDAALPNNTVASNAVSIPGAYNYSYIVANEACPADTAEITVVYQDCLGLDEDQIGNITVYPNPSNGVINIANNGNTSEFSVKIQDVRGKVVYTNTPNLATGSVESIDLTSNNKGIYFVTLTSEGSTNQYKVVLQ